jgi:hypothetical protein
VPGLKSLKPESDPHPAFGHLLPAEGEGTKVRTVKTGGLRWYVVSPLRREIHNSQLHSGCESTNSNRPHSSSLVTLNEAVTEERTGP